MILWLLTCPLPFVLSKQLTVLQLKIRKASNHYNSIMKSLFYGILLALICLIQSCIGNISDADIEGLEIMNSIEEIERTRLLSEQVTPSTSKRSFVAETKNSRTASWRVVSPVEHPTHWDNNVIETMLEEQERQLVNQYMSESIASQEYLNQQLRLAEEEERYNEQNYSHVQLRRLRNARRWFS